MFVLGALPRRDGRPGRALRRRMAHGLALFAAGAAPCLVVSGGNSAGGVVEADLMADMAREAGVPAPALIIDRTAANTLQSAQACRALAARHGWRRVLVVSDAWHLPRAVFAFSRLGVRATAAPVPAHLEPDPLLTGVRYRLREAAAWAKYLLVLARRR